MGHTAMSTADLCPKHNLAIAPDGRCVLCRRPKGMTLHREDESWLSRILTWTLLGCLVATFSGLVYIARTPTGHQGARFVRNDNPMGPSRARAQTQESIPPSERSPVAPPAAAIAAAPAPADVVLPAQLTIAAEDEVAPTPLRRPPAAPQIPAGELQEARKKVEVVMFGAPWCYICDRSRDFLSARDVELVEYDIELHPEALDALTDTNPAGNIPTFQIQNETIVGFHPWMLEDAINAAALEHYASR